MENRMTFSEAIRAAVWHARRGGGQRAVFRVTPERESVRYAAVDSEGADYIGKEFTSRDCRERIVAIIKGPQQ
jgi:hypothetical protein